MASEQEIICADYDELSETEILVTLIVSKTTISPARIQKIAQFYYNVVDDEERKTSFYMGFSDDVDEAINNLAGIGILGKCGGLYALSDYGHKLWQYITKEYIGNIQIGIVDNIVFSVSLLSDKRLSGILYFFYGNIADGIIDSVERFNKRSYYDGILLQEYPKEEFVSKCLRGDKIEPN